MVRRNLVALITVLVLLAAGCGKSSSTVTVEATGEFLAASADRTVEEGTGRYEATVSYTGEDAAFFGDAELTMTGAYDVAAERWMGTADMGAFITDMLEGSMLQGDTLDPAAEAELSRFRELAESGELQMEMVQDGTVLYMHLGLFTALAQMEGTEGVPADLRDRWMRMDLTELGGMGQLQESLGTSGSMDPQATLEMLHGSAGGVEDRGSAEVRGVETTRLSGTVTIRDAIEAQPDAELRERMEGMLAGLGMSGMLDLEYSVEVFVDDQGRVRRVAMDIPLDEAIAEMPEEALGVEGAGDAAALPTDLGMSMTMDYFDLGEDVEIRVPAADETVDHTELFPQGQMSGVVGPGQAPMSS